MKVSDSLEDKIKLCIQTIKLKPLMRKQLRNGWLNIKGDKSFLLKGLHWGHKDCVTRLH